VARARDAGVANEGFRARPPPPHTGPHRVTDVRVMIVDVYVLRPAGAGVEVLCLRRAPGQRSAGTWETVHGHVRDGERPADAAARELGEETGLTAQRLYNLSRVESFYLHRRDAVALIPAFCAVAPAGAVAALSAEHDRAEWVAPEEAARRFAWPRERRALADALALLPAGEAGALDDVLRVR
jgi:dATP pyrophosphohydrolase